MTHGEVIFFCSDVFEDYVSPVTAAQTLLHTVAKKRKDMLQKAMEFVMTVLTNTSSTAYQKYGALHMVGSVADVLLKVNEHIIFILSKFTCHFFCM